MKCSFDFLPLSFSTFCLTVLCIYHPYPIQHKQPAPSYFFPISPTFPAPVPIFSTSDSYPCNLVSTLCSITMFLRKQWLCASLLPKSFPYSPSNYLWTLSDPHTPPPYPFLAIPPGAFTFASFSHCYLLNPMFFSCLVQQFLSSCSVSLTSGQHIVSIPVIHLWPEHSPPRRSCPKEMPSSISVPLSPSRPPVVSPTWAAHIGALQGV